MSKSKVVLIVFALICLVSVFAIQMFRGTGDLYFDERGGITDPYLLQGQALSQLHCGSCHLYPDPSLLPKSTWRFETLPAIAPFMGVDPFTGEGVQHSPRNNPFLPDHIYPSEPLVTPGEWQNIVDFYWHVAPDELARLENVTEIISDSLFFNALTPDYRPESDPIVTAVKFDDENGFIYVSNTTDLTFYAFDRELEMVHNSSIESPVSQFEILNEGSDEETIHLLVTFIGHLYPSDAPYGSIRKGYFDPVHLESEFDSVISGNLARPVGGQYADLSMDGSKELIVNEFGHRSGSLFILAGIEEGEVPVKTELINTPGCIQSYVLDYTGNGWPDIVSLCTQTDQSIYLFENKGDGEFVRSSLLQFEITAGSSSFELADFTGDGNMDILYTSGDNADYSKVFKPYHGVYIFLNDGESQFTNEWFYPLNGAYNAQARDFNGNGYLDIAVISFFADYESTPEEGFIFFKNEGNLTFTPYHHPSTSKGRWLTMDVADWTGNGRYDILLGNSSVGVFGASDVPQELQEKWENGPMFMLLENALP